MHLYSHKGDKQPHTLISPRYINSITSLTSANFIPLMIITGCWTWCCLNSSWNITKGKSVWYQ